MSSTTRDHKPAHPRAGNARIPLCSYLPNLSVTQMRPLSMLTPTPIWV